MFWDATNKRGLLVIEGDEFCLVTNIGRAVAGDECCAGVAIKRGTIILSFSMLLNDFRARGPISIYTLPVAALAEFSHADAETNVNTLLVLWYFISSLLVYLCSCTRIMSMIRSIAAAVSSSSWPILFNVLKLNVTICILRLHLSNFCFSLSYLAGFSSTGTWAPTSVGQAPFVPTQKAMQFGHVVWVWVMIIF